MLQGFEKHCCAENNSEDQNYCCDYAPIIILKKICSTRWSVIGFLDEIFHYFIICLQYVLHKQRIHHV